MTDVTERSEVERLLQDPAYAVPEADAASTRAAARLRANASRFANGATHDERRLRIDALLAGLDADRLASDARSRTRALRSAGATVDEIAERVPVAVLADALGFDDPDAAPEAAAVLATTYPTGEPSTTADAAAARLLDAAGPRDAALRAQLLVQAHAATAGLIMGALGSPAADVADSPTADLLATTLRDDPPVRQTRRVGPDGGVVTLRLDGPDQGSPRAPRTLAFGAGPRACPTRAHALAIAAAVVDEVRAC